MEKEVIISARHLKKVFGSGDSEQVIYSDFDIDIFKGDFTVIMGGRRKIHADVFAFGYGYTERRHDQFLRYGDHRHEQRRACCFQAEELWICLSADVFDRQNEFNG